jgi:large subunit ribosomal protein L9
MNVEVVLTDNDPKLGKRGEVVKVSQGFALNYLIPNRKAVMATKENLKSFAAEKAGEERRQAEKLAAAKETAAKISAVSVKIPMQAGDGDKLYGAVTNQDVQAALSAKGIAIERRDIHLDEPIKRLGDYTVQLKLHPEVSAKLAISVVKK